jgi:hypothetical protein
MERMSNRKSKEQPMNRHNAKQEIELTREQIWIMGLAALLALALVAGIVTVVTLRADLDALDRQVAALAGGDSGQWSVDSEADTDEWGAQPAPTGYVNGMAVLSDTFRLTVTVSYAGAGNLLYEPPILVSQATQAAYHPTPASLEQLRLSFLSLSTGGQATGSLVFRPVPARGEGLALVFNPSHQAGDIVAPRWEMRVRANGQMSKRERLC